MANFVKHSNCPNCGSKDNLAIYDDGSYYCFSGCGNVKVSEEYKELHEDNLKHTKIFVRASVKNGEEIMSEQNQSNKPAITEEEVKRIRESTEESGKGFRGIRDDIYKTFRVRHGVDDSCDIAEQYYPVTQEGQITGYKIREVPKSFRSKGRTGADCDLFMQFKFNRGGKYCVPMSTKALTRRGWLGYDEITTDDYVLAYDINDGTKKWTKVLAKHLRNDLEVFEFGAGKQKLQSTENHRWLVSQKTSGADKRDVYFKTEYRTLADINTASGIIVNAKTNENISTGIGTLSENKYGVNWVDRVIKMSQEQRISFLDGILLADGCFTKNGWEACQNDGPLFEGILLACYLVHDKLVRVKKTKPNHKGNVMKHVVLSNAKTRSRLKEHFVSKGIQDTWCITTALDSWVIRQGDFITLTGNCLLVEGELDSLSAYQMLSDYNKSRNSDFETAVVSPTVGANSKKQIAAQYKFFDSFEQIIVAFDSDEAGQKASEEIVKHLPKGKVKLMKMRFKDPNEYLMKGKSKEFVSDFYSAKPYIPVGVVGSGDIVSSMREEFLVPKIPLPPFMHKLQAMMAGGIPLGRIVNLASASGTGKSTIVDEIVYHMIFNSPHKVGIVTLESTTGQYGIKLLSRHISLKLELLQNEEALTILDSEKTKEKEKELFWRENGEHRFYLVDDRDGGVENVKDAIENLIIGCDCKVIVCDPVHDVIGTLPNEEQESFYAWQKGMVKSHNCTFYNVMHTRKTANGQKAGSAGADLHEEDIQGASAAYKSAACNLMFSRNKEAEDEIERNTTVMKATKIRWTGKTGIAGKYYYDNERHTLHDLDDWVAENT